MIAIELDDWSLRSVLDSSALMSTVKALLRLLTVTVSGSVELMSLAAAASGYMAVVFGHVFSPRQDKVVFKDICIGFRQLPFDNLIRLCEVAGRLGVEPWRSSEISDFIVAFKFI